MKLFRSLVPILIASLVSLTPAAISAPSSSGFNFNGVAQFNGMIPGFRTVTGNTTATATDFFLCYTSTSSAYTVTLSPAASFSATKGRANGGAVLAIVDCSGVAGTHNITITPSGSDTINGSGSSVTIAVNGGDSKLFTDGISKWWTWGVAPGTNAPLASPALTGTPTINGGNASYVPFGRTCTLTSAAAGTAVHCLAAADVGSAQKAFITGFHIKINGATNWATTATCTIQDTAGSPVVYATVAIAAMTGNAYISTTTSNVTLASPFNLGTGGTAAKGVDFVCNANGTGSDAVLTIDGYMH